MKWLIGTLGVVILLTGVGCDAPRLNPFDPRVDTITVLLTKTGYFPATYRFPILANSNQFVGFLNAKPVIRQLKFVTIHNVASQVDYIRLELPGLNFQLVVYNTNRDSIIEEPLVLRRVINADLTPLLPNPERAESGSILFTWKAVQLDYPFSFRVVLYASAGTITKIGEFYPIPSTATQFELTDPDFLASLETGTYLWNLEIEDEFGNIAESSVLQFQYFK